VAPTTEARVVAPTTEARVVAPTTVGALVPGAGELVEQAAGPLVGPKWASMPVGAPTKRAEAAGAVAAPWEPGVPGMAVAAGAREPVAPQMAVATGEVIGVVAPIEFVVRAAVGCGGGEPMWGRVVCRRW
jgi:hypothetical protein